MFLSTRKSVGVDNNADNFKTLYRRRRRDSTGTGKASKPASLSHTHTHF